MDSERNLPTPNVTAPNRPLIAAIFGSSTALPGDRCCRLAHELGAGLARRGVRLRNGGYDGVMAAASRGAREAGGYVTGITVGRLNGIRAPNPWLSENRAEKDILARLRRLIRGTDIFYAIEGGGPGTLNEVFLVWAMMMIGDLEPRPLVLVGSGWPELNDCLGAHFGFSAEAAALVRLAPDAAAALAEIERLSRR